MVYIDKEVDLVFVHPQLIHLDLFFHGFFLFGIVVSEQVEGNSERYCTKESEEPYALVPRRGDDDVYQVYRFGKSSVFSVA